MSHPIVWTKRRRVFAILTISVIAILILAYCAHKKVFEYTNPYHNWPSVDTMSVGTPLYINGLVVLTCDEQGKPRLDERSFGTDKEGRKVLPSEYIAFYTDYFPKESEDCEVRLAPRIPSNLILRIMETNGENWGGQLYNFHSMASSL